MINLHLTRCDDDEGVYLKLPATQAEIEEAFGWLDEISPDAPSRITEAVSNVYNLGSYLKNVDADNPVELEKLSALATKLQTMDRDSCFKLEGVLDANSVNGLDDILRLADALGDYALLPDAHNGGNLGKYLVDNEIVAFPESVRPYLDYQVIGQEFYADHGGAFCRGGYAVRWDELPEQFRQTSDWQEDAYPILLRLTTAHTAADLPLPATDEALEQAKRELGIDEFAEARLAVVDYTYPYLAQMIPRDGITVDDANALAEAILQINQTDGELLKYLSVLEIEQPETFSQALELASNIDNYERMPAGPEEYGRQTLFRAGHEILDEIEGYMDYETYGRYWMRADGARQTEFGCIRRLSEPFDAPEMGGMKMQ